jgi:hypothetical protein
MGSCLDPEFATLPLFVSEWSGDDEPAVTRTASGFHKVKASGMTGNDSIPLGGVGVEHINFREQGRRIASGSASPGDGLARLTLLIDVVHTAICLNLSDDGQSASGGRT